MFLVIAGSGSYSNRCEFPIGIFLTIDGAENCMAQADDQWEDFQVFEAEIGEEPMRVCSYERPSIQSDKFPFSWCRGRPVLIPE